ncbi:MAG: hypothetical protein AAGM67_20970, partial [Bacteroidota bacterium]
TSNGVKTLNGMSQKMLAQEFSFALEEGSLDCRLVFSGPHEGTVDIWDDQKRFMGSVDLKRYVDVISKADQQIPAGGVFDLMMHSIQGGYIRSDVPIYCALYSSKLESMLPLSISHATQSQVLLGVTHADRKAYVKADAAGIKRVRTLDENGLPVWRLQSGSEQVPS